MSCVLCLSPGVAWIDGGVEYMAGRRGREGRGGRGVEAMERWKGWLMEGARTLLEDGITHIVEEEVRKLVSGETCVESRSRSRSSALLRLPPQTPSKNTLFYVFSRGF